MGGCQSEDEKVKLTPKPNKNNQNISEESLDLGGRTILIFNQFGCNEDITVIDALKKSNSIDAKYEIEKIKAIEDKFNCTPHYHLI